MFRLIVQALRDYHNAREQLYEQSVNIFESKIPPLTGLLFSMLLLALWLNAVFYFQGFANLYEQYEYFPFIVFFLTSYFTFYSGSKFIFKPTPEEISDDTSIFALFSACGRKEMRSWVSICLSIVHTLIFVLYLINMDLKFI